MPEDPFDRNGFLFFHLGSDAADHPTAGSAGTNFLAYFFGFLRAQRSAKGLFLMLPMLSSSALQGLNSPNGSMKKKSVAARQGNKRGLPLTLLIIPKLK